MCCVRDWITCNVATLTYKEMASVPTTTRLWQDEYFTADRPGQESDLFQSNNQQTTLDVLAQVV